MRMVCPACSAAYEVPESLLIPGRVVRCARCANQWVPVAATQSPPPEPPPPRMSPTPAPPWTDAELIEEVEIEPSHVVPPDTPRFTAMDRLALHRASVEGSPVPLRVAWAASIVALLLLGAAAFIFHAEVAHVWPASQRVYQALGVIQSPSGRP